MGVSDEQHVSQYSRELRDSLCAIREVGIYRVREFSPVLLKSLSIPEGTSFERKQEQVHRSLMLRVAQINEKQRRAFLEAAGFRRNAAVSRGERLQSAMALLEVSERTAYRLIDAAVAALVRVLTSEIEGKVLQEISYCFSKAVCRIDLTDAKPVVVTERIIVAQADGLTYLDERIRFSPTAGEPLMVRALEGCSIEDSSLIAPGIWSLRLGFPRTLRLGDEHAFAVSVMFPSRDALEPVAGFLPHTASFDARIELLFGDIRPQALHRFATTPPLEPDDRVPAESWISPLESNHDFTFDAMRPGLCYGVRWRW